MRVRVPVLAAGPGSVRAAAPRTAVVTVPLGAVPVLWPLAAGPLGARVVPFVGVEDVLHYPQSADLAVGQVYLGDVAGHHDLRAEPEAGEEHLHLLGGGVLRLVEDDERVVEAASAHEGERGDLDRARGGQ